MWQFGEVEFDENEGGLRVAGKKVELDRNCGAILSVMLQEAGAPVSKERLLQAGWPSRIVHENSLAKAIGRLRQVLGAEGDALETIYGFGYRLKADVRRLEPPAGVSATLAGPGKHPARSGTRRAAFVLTAIVLIGLIGLAGAFLLTRAESSAANEFRRTPPIIGDAPDSIGRLLWVDDHPQNNIYEQRFFEDRRIAVHTVTGSTDALRLLAMYDYDVVLSDMGRGEDRLAGLRLVEQMRAKGDRTPFIIYTVRPDGAEAQQAQRHLVAEAGGQGVAVTPQEVRSVIVRLFGNPAPRAAMP